MVESYSDKTLKAYSGMIADPKSVFGLGSAAATSSMCAASMALRALRMTASEDADMLHAEQDMEKLRVYFLHLVDEENKAKKPLEKLLKQENADDTELEAAYRTACCIIDEIFYMSIRIVETLVEPVGGQDLPLRCTLCLRGGSLCKVRHGRRAHPEGGLRRKDERAGVCAHDQA